MAYVFMSDEGDQSWDVEFGSNAVILQPGPFRPHVETSSSAVGPTLQKMVDGPTGNELVPVDVEYTVELLDLPDKAVEDKDFTLATRIGGPAGWLQNDDTPADGPWRLVIQIDSATDKFWVNFGDAGVGYAFISEDGAKARFLWQCC